jgi:hypothetical protein
MKLPIWAKDKEGNWEVFPTHMVETLIDGSRGFKFQLNEHNGEKSAAFTRFRDHFEPNPLRKPLPNQWVYPIQYRLRNQ